MARGSTNRRPGSVLGSSAGGGLSPPSMPAQRPSCKSWEIRVPVLAASMRASGTFAAELTSVFLEVSRPAALLRRWVKGLV